MPNAHAVFEHKKSLLKKEGKFLPLTNPGKQYLSLSGNLATIHTSTRYGPVSVEEVEEGERIRFKLNAMQVPFFQDLIDCGIFPANGFIDDEEVIQIIGNSHPMHRLFSGDANIGQYIEFIVAAAGGGLVRTGL